MLIRSGRVDRGQDCNLAFTSVICLEGDKLTP